MRLFLPLLLLWTGIQTLTGQSLPSYLKDTYPAANASGVPTNVDIVLRANVTIQAPPFATAGYYTLKAGSGDAITLTSPVNCSCFGTVLVPSASLSPNTLYTFTINPGSATGPAYSFSFTTGAGPDHTPPHLLSANPPSGSAGLGLAGPFQFHFDKRITHMTQQNQAVMVRAQPTYLAYYPSTALSSDGTTVIVTMSLQQGYPLGYEITIDPTQFFDASGNTGQGAPMVASYSTFISTDTSGPHLQASLPADEDTSVPTNVIPRLVFDKTVDTSTFTSGIQLLSGGVAQSLSFNSANGSGPITLTPTKPLSPNQTYTIAIGTALRDQNGFPIGQPQSISFTTGSGPDTVTPTVVATSPNGAVYPPNAQILIKTNKPISPIVLTRLGAIGLTTGPGSNPTTPVPANATLSPDGTLLTLTPQSPLTGQYYALATSEIVDTTGATFFPQYSSISFTVSGNTATVPPTLLAVSPPPDSTTVPTSANVRLVFNEPCATCLFPNAITLSANGSVVPARLSVDYSSSSNTSNTSFTLTPTLTDSTTYTVSLTGILDLAGNAMPDYSFSFTTGSSDYVPPTLLSSSVNNGDTNVDPAGSFVFQYNFVLNPATSLSAATITGPSNFGYPAIGSASGSTLTITPTNPLPANTTFRLSLTAVSLSGGALATQVTFTTAPSSDTTRPEVTSISPAAGSVIPQGSVPIVLTFSKPLNPSTVTGSSIALYIDDSPSITQPVRSADNRSVTITAPNAQTDSLSVVVSSSIQDLEGNPVVPFEASFQVQPKTPQPGSSFIHEMRPAFGSTNVPTSTAVTWFLDQPVDLAAIQASLVALVNLNPVPGTFALAGDGRVLRFTPDSPFPAGSSVSFYERTAILGISNGYGYSSFTIAPPPSTSLQYVRSTFGNSNGIDSVFEIEFNQDPPLGQTIASFTYSTGNGYGTPVPFTESIPRPHVLRLTTTQPRRPGYYGITLSSIVVGDVNSPRYLNTTLVATPVGGTPTVASAGPAPSSTAVPVNASPHVLFGAPINALSATAQTVTLAVGGSTVPAQISYPSNNREMIVRPLQALPPNATVSVSLSGLQDLAGNTIPDYSWSFTTAVDPDFAGPSVLYTSLPTVSGGGGVQIAANEAVQIVFSKPIDPGISIQIGYSGSGWLNNAATVSVSPDLRVVTVAPITAWALGQQYSLNLNYEYDLEGNVASYSGSNSPYSTNFTVAFAPSTTPPGLRAVSPPDGSTAMPLNARVMLAFDRPVTIPPGGLTLTDSGGNNTPIEQIYNTDATLAVFASELPLLPDTAYTISLTNATDLSGNPIAAPAGATFTTGEVLDTTNPGVSAAFTSPLPTNMPLRFRFTEPVSPATVGPARFQLFAGTIPQPVSVSLSGDGTTVTVTPQQPLVPGTTYTYRIAPPTDFAGNTASFPVGTGTTSTFVAGSSDVTAASVVTIFPVDGTTGVPVRAQSAAIAFTPVRVSFSTAPDLVTSPPVLQVLQNGNPIAGSVTVNSSGMTFSPASPLQYSTTYQVVVSGVVDYIGNAAPTVTTSFTTSASQADDAAKFSVVSIQPADGSVGVDSNAPIVVTFTKLPDPSFANFPLTSTPSFPIRGQWTASGYTLTFTPAQPWPSGVTITSYIASQGYAGGYFRDLSGLGLDKNYSFSFKAAVVPDSTPPALISITPADGTSIPPIGTTFTLVFNEPVTVGSQALQAFNGSTAANVSSNYSLSSYNAINLTVSSVSPDSVLTIVGTNGIQDANGNSITPFSFSYPTLHSDQSGPPAVSSISPKGYATGVDASTPIKITFNKPMNPDSLLNSVIVTQNGVLIKGQLQVMDSNQSIEFTPDTPYLDGARIDVFVLTTATDPAGAPLPQQYQANFTVASPQSSGQVRMTAAFAGFGEAVDPSAAFDLAFDHDLDPASVTDQNVWLRLDHTRIAGTVSLRDRRTLRFEPAAPLTIGAQYVLTAGPGLRSREGFAGQPREFHFRAELAEPVRIESVEYERGPAPLAIRIRFTGPVSRIAAGELQLVALDGSAVPATIQPSTDGREWLVLLSRPQPVRLLFQGVLDQWGRRLPREERRPGEAR